jgi:hypothetical protein
MPLPTEPTLMGSVIEFVSCVVLALPMFVEAIF